MDPRNHREQSADHLVMDVGEAVAAALGKRGQALVIDAKLAEDRRVQVMEMIAVDTNVVIRLLVDDHPAEGKRARQVFENHRGFLPESVSLESEWVLRAVYGFSREEISQAFRALLRLPKVAVDERALVMLVLDWFDECFDFVDALHYARSAGLELKTFDRKFLNKGRKQHWKISPP